MNNRLCVCVCMRVVCGLAGSISITVCNGVIFIQVLSLFANQAPLLTCHYVTFDLPKCHTSVSSDMPIGLF